MTIGLIGTGAMGGAMLKGITRNLPDITLVVYDRDEARMREAAAVYGARIAASEAEVARQADTVVLAVKPQHMDTVLGACAALGDAQPLYLTIAAGLPIAFFLKHLGPQTRVVRAMPNTPALIGEGMTLYCCSPAVTAQDRWQAVALLGSVGQAEELEERYLNEIIAVTGSSPAFFFMMLEAMGDAAVQSGLPRAAAYRWAATAMSGSARLLLETGKHPGELKDMVTSPAGTTIDGVAVLEDKGFRSAVMSAMAAVTRRAREIGRVDNNQ
jgi:pyrroline-5-carboxylate reductase